MAGEREAIRAMLDLDAPAFEGAMVELLADSSERQKAVFREALL